MLIFILLTLTQAGKFQTGIHEAGYIGCGNAQTYISTIQFEEIFINIPQVIITQQSYDQYPGAKTLISTSDVTNTQFNIVAQCDGAETFSIIIEWIAVDDNKFEFLNSYNNDVTNLNSQTFTLSHSDPNHVQAFVGLTSFWFLGDINFNIALQQINPTNVVVKFTQTQSNVHNIGFFVMLGTVDAFTISAQRTNSSLSIYNSETYTSPIQLTLNSKLFVVFQGIQFIQPPPSIYTVDNFRLKQLSKIKNDATVQYCVETWQNTNVQQAQVQEIIFVTSALIHMPSLVLKKFRCAKKNYPNQDSNQIKVKIIELMDDFISSTQQVQLDASIEKFVIVIQFQCELGTFLSAQFQLCYECDQPYFSYQQQCYDGINLIEFTTTLLQDSLIQSKLLIEINENQLTISTLIPNIIGDVPYNTIIISLNEV